MAGRSPVSSASPAPQAKTALLEREGRWGVPSGATPTTHILKPAVAGLDDHDLNEHLCLDAARRTGLIAARTRIERFGEETAVVVTRYDRITTGETIRRVHQENLCQALGAPPTRKYQNEGGPGPVQIVRLLRSAMRSAIAEDSVRRFADALAWNWLIAGTDAVRELAALTLDTLADAVAAPEVKALDRPLPARLLDLVADRAQRCQQLLDASPRPHS